MPAVGNCYGRSGLSVGLPAPSTWAAGPVTMLPAPGLPPGPAHRRPRCRLPASHLPRESDAPASHRWPGAGVPSTDQLKPKTPTEALQACRPDRPPPYPARDSAASLRHSNCGKTRLHLCVIRTAEYALHPVAPSVRQPAAAPHEVPPARRTQVWYVTEST